MPFIRAIVANIFKLLIEQLIESSLSWIATNARMAYSLKRVRDNELDFLEYALYSCIRGKYF